MPLNKKCSISALEENIASEIRAGRPREQAVAIAHRTLRDACKAAGKPVPTRKAFEVINDQPTVGVRALVHTTKSTAGALKDWMEKHDIKLDPHGAFKSDGVDIEIDNGVIAKIASRRGVVAKRRLRTMEFLEEAFARARAVLNPRDFAVIFQAARASAGGQISSKRRKERALSAAEKQLVGKAGLSDMSNAELQDLNRSLNKAYSQAKKAGNDVRRAMSRAESLRQEFRRRELPEPTGPVYVELKKRGKKDVRKGFVSGQPEGGMHAHGLDRRNSKTLDDGGHMHIWTAPGTGEIIISDEDGWHQHELSNDDPSAVVTPLGGEHSHRVMLPNGAMIETKLGGSHAHALMVETSGFDGPHEHDLVMPDGTVLKSMTVNEFVATLTEPPRSEHMASASMITRALLDLRALRESTDVGGPLPSPLPDLPDAVEMSVNGETVAPPTFTMEVVDAGHGWVSCGDGEHCLTVKNHIGAEMGDMVEMRYDGELVGFSKHVVPDDDRTIKGTTMRWQAIVKHTTKVPFVGPGGARLMFVSTAPNELELARKQALVGDDALTFEDVYLKPLGMTKRDVAVGFAMPVLPHGDLTVESCEKWSGHLIEAMKSYPNAKVVALGKIARDVMKSAGVEFWSLPHPSAVRRKGDRGEVGRKLRAIAKSLDVGASMMQDRGVSGSGPSNGSAPRLADAISEMRKTGHTTCRVVKSADEKQIVYGVVLDPYEVDLQTEWVPPVEIESTAHGFMKKSRVIGFEHVERAEAQIVESWVEPYPSKVDYQAALENRPHRAYTRKFGDDVIHSGTWVAGVQLGDREWALHKQGKLNAFSVGGFSFKSKVTTAVMPEVEFIELIEAPA